MSYVSLYRRYRPSTFDEIVGQDHVTRTLANAITEGRLHHAYLFTGPRGTGKTSTARILAKAVNCADGPTATPCGTCSFCVEISGGTSMDVIELDMASHGGVDDARELRDRALFAPARARRKVYILDEVHMASPAAFNALLKLIEEPPEHVLFAMATTDPHKVLPTIMSRVQRLDLRRVDESTMKLQLQRIADAEGLRIDDAAFAPLVRAGDGSVRDTLSVLEQVLSFAGDHVTRDMVEQLLGSSPTEAVFATMAALLDGDVAAALTGVQDLVDTGHDLRRFALELAQHARDVLVSRVAPGRPELIDAPDDRRRRLAEQATRASQPWLVDAVAVLGETIVEQRQGGARLPLEISLARLATTVSPPAETGSDAVAAHIEVEESEETSGQDGPASDDVGVAPTPAEDSHGAEPSAPAPAQATTMPGVVVASEAPSPDGVSGTDLDTIRAHWDGILEAIKQQSRRCHALFEPAKPTRAGRGILTLRYGRRYASFHAVNAGKAEFADMLCGAIERACGLRVRLEIVTEGDDERRRPQPPDVTPPDARTPVIDAPEPRTPSEPADEESDVREAESGHHAASPGDVSELLADQLGAELVDERPASGER